MSGIIGLNGQRFASTLPEPPTPLEVVSGLKALLSCRAITLDAYNLGLMLCAQAQKSKLREITIAHDTARQIVVEVQKQVFSGAVGHDRLDFIRAMQGLHFKAGILSHYDAEKLDALDAAEHHFTLSAEVGSDEAWDAHTAIAFRLPTCMASDYTNHIQGEFQHAMKRIAGSLKLDLLADVAQRH